ncbi:MAG: feruloyl-CoA synthase [Rhodospirillales bacterium]|nr:feruloyl-CoA synthase [Rhodospirillales bacterium]
MTAPIRPVRLGSPDVRFTHLPDGTIHVRPNRTLPPYPARITDRLAHWAAHAPDRAFLARRDAGGAWRSVTYAEAFATVGRIGQALLDRGLSPERPVAILSGNGIEHALLGLAAMHVGVPYAPISPAYSLVSRDYLKLLHIIRLLRPGLVFAESGSAFAAAIAAAAPPDAEVVVAGAVPNDRPVTTFDTLARTAATAAVAAAAAAVGPDTVAKILFTSGSTGVPKGVINTQRMLTSNQEMLRTSMAFLADEPPVIVDWLPWNHTFGGNHNVGLVLYNGGTLYIDDGKPTPAGIAETVRNLREIAPTIYFNVPKGFEELVAYLRAEPDLRAKFFSRVKLMFYAGAGLAQHVWDALDELAVAAVGERITMLTGLGMTETAPFSIVCRPDVTGSGIVGLPVTGNDLKLVPGGGKLEARIKGPNVTPGFWRQEEMTRAVFDEDGYYRTGDALTFVDPEQPALGLRFDGRISEDFKLATGTWVSVGPLRAHLIERLAPWVRDVVIAGHDRDYISVLLIPDMAACRAAAAGLAEDAAVADVLAHPALRAQLRRALAVLARESTGSSMRVRRALLLHEPPSIDAGEITDKGSINQRAVLARRADLVAALYAEPPLADIICVEETT